MKANWRVTCASIALALIFQGRAFNQSQNVPSQHAAKIEALAKEYNAFGRKEWKKRRDFCIRLIDEGIVGDNAKTSDIRHIFEPDLYYHEKTNDHPAGGFVAFERPKNQKSNVQNRIGWHFSFECSDNGYLWNYWLTDFNK